MFRKSFSNLTNIVLYYTLCYSSHLTLSGPEEGGGGGGLRGPDDQTHSCQSEATYFMMPKHGEF